MPSPQQSLQKLFKKGLKYHREGRIAQAESCYRKILRLNPTSLEAREMARILETKPGSLQEALPPANSYLDADPATLAARTAEFLAKGKNQPAIDCLRRLTELRPDSVQAHLQLGEVLERTEDFKAAAKSYQRALDLQPGSADLHCYLARALFRSGAPREAAELYQRALAIDSQRYDIYNDLGLMLTNVGNFGAAIEAFKRSLRLNPQCAKTIAGLGYLFESKGDFISASEAYRDAIKLDPTLAAAYVDLGFILYGLGEVAEATDYFERLRAIQPDSAEATANLGIIHLLQGNFAAGWAEYEARRRVGIGEGRVLTQRQWKGEPLNGATILLHAEQGFGDTLQFVRYVPLVAARGGKVVLEVQPGLRRLLSRTDGAMQVVSRGEPLPEFARQCPLPSLPLAFGTEMNTIPAKVPYVYPDPVLVDEWREKLQGDGRRIGLVWGGNPEMQRDRLRSVPLDALMPILKVPGITFYSLQVGAASAQVKNLPRDVRVIDLAPQLKDFADTAAAVANLDLVISVETSVAHLAGAMGRPLWIMLNKGCDWRWFLEREDSPWYPTARLFRQSAIGEWKDVVSCIEGELRGRQNSSQRMRDW